MRQSKLIGAAAVGTVFPFIVYCLAVIVFGFPPESEIDVWRGTLFTISLICAPIGVIVYKENF